MIKTDLLRDQSVKVGQTLKLAVPFNADPLPKVTFKLADGTVLNDLPQCKVDTTQGQAVMTLNDCQRDWTGPLDIIVANDHGEAEARINLTVFGLCYIFIFI